MANKKITKKTKPHPRRMYRNAATSTARSVPRAVVVRPRGPIAGDLAAEDEDELELQRKKKKDTPAWTAIKAAGGALASTVAGAYLAQQDWVPPKVMTGVITGLSAILALEGPEKLKPLGIGAMSAAGAQLGFMLIDDQLLKSSEDKKQQVASKPPALPAGKRQAGDIPADALARAYERARLRMAMTSEPAN